MLKTPILCVATAALLIAPAAASAKGTVTAGPIKAKGYGLTITATDGGARDSLSITALKTAGRSQQMHAWTFRNGIKVAVSGGKATIKGSLGRYGKIDARVASAGRSRRGACGSTYRSGTLTGRTKLVLDTTFFHTVKPKSVPARVITPARKSCPAGDGGGGQGGGETPTPQHGLMLSSTAGPLTISVVKTGSHVTQTVMRNDPAADTAPAEVFHSITASTGPAGLHAAPDLQSASAPATGAFLLGQLAFAGTPMGDMATGTISGDYAAKFDSIGQQWLPEGTEAILMRH